MNIKHLLKDTVTVAHITGVSEAGDPQYGVQSTINARVEHSSELIPGQDGTYKEAEHVFVTLEEVKHTDRVWLPGDNTADSSAARRPITVTKAATLHGGMTLYEVKL